MHVVTVEFEIAPDHQESFRQAVLRQAANSLRNEETCRQFDVCVSTDDPGRVFLYELYDDADAFARHLDSAHFREFDRLVGPWVESKKVQSWTRQ